MSKCTIILCASAEIVRETRLSLARLKLWTLNWRWAVDNLQNNETQAPIKDSFHGCRGVYPLNNIGAISPQPGEVLREGQGGCPQVCPHTKICPQTKFFVQYHWTSVVKIMLFYSKIIFKIKFLFFKVLSQNWSWLSCVIGRWGQTPLPLHDCIKFSR